MNRVSVFAVLGAIALFGFVSAQTCTDDDVQELRNILSRVQSCIPSVCRVAQNESACDCCSRIQASANPTPTEVSCCEEFTTSNSLYKQCKDRLMDRATKTIDPGIILEIVNNAIKLGLQFCKLISAVIPQNAGASVQGLPVLGLLVIGIGSFGIFFV